MHQPVMRVKPWGEGQGDFVEINVEDFNPDFHRPLDAVEKPADKPTGKRAAKKADASAPECDAVEKPAE